MDPTEEELSGATSQFAEFLKGHPDYGTPNDGMLSYQRFRQQGYSHADALASTFKALGWVNAPKTEPTTTPTPTTTPSGPKAPTSYDFNAARAKIEQGIGRALTDADIARLFKEVGGSQSSQFDDAGITKAIALMKGPGPGTTDVPGFPTPAPSGLGSVNLPHYNTPAPYEFQPFKAPTAADILSDPSFGFRFDQGQKALERSRTAGGIINTGDTAKALLGYGQDFASQEYKNIYDRDFSTWNANEGGRFNTYLTNVKTQNDTPYANSYASALDTRRGDEFNYNSAYNQWVEQYNQWRNNKNDTFDQRWKVASS